QAGGSFLYGPNTSSPCWRGFFFSGAPTSAGYPLSLHDALPIWLVAQLALGLALAGCTLGPDYHRPTVSAPEVWRAAQAAPEPARSEEHTSELQSRFDLVCRLLLEKKRADTAGRTAAEWTRKNDI